MPGPPAPQKPSGGCTGAGGGSATFRLTGPSPRWERASSTWIARTQIATSGGGASSGLVTSVIGESLLAKSTIAFSSHVHFLPCLLKSELRGGCENWLAGLGNMGFSGHPRVTCEASQPTRQPSFANARGVCMGPGCLPKPAAVVLQLLLVFLIVPVLWSGVALGLGGVHNLFLPVRMPVWLCCGTPGSPPTSPI